MVESPSSPTEHQHRKQGRGQDLELVQELERRPVQVGNGHVVEIVLHHVEGSGHGHLQQVRRLVPHIFAEGFPQLPKAAVLLKTLDRGALS